VPYRQELPIGAALAPERRRRIMLFQVLGGLAVGATDKNGSVPMHATRVSLQFALG
jgi:hypothetical protein